jgi:hypothetical protein
MLSLVDGVEMPNPDDKLVFSSMATLRNTMCAFGSLAEFLRQHSSPTIYVAGSTVAKVCKLGAPLAIDAVEPLSPSLRYSELSLPAPHPSLGGPRAGKKMSDAAPTSSLIQIRFGHSLKWPTDFKATGAAKTPCSFNWQMVLKA